MHTVRSACTLSKSFLLMSWNDKQLTGRCYRPPPRSQWRCLCLRGQCCGVIGMTNASSKWPDTNIPAQQHHNQQQQLIQTFVERKSEKRQITNMTTEHVTTNLVCFSEDTDIRWQLHPYQIKLMRLWVNSTTSHIRYSQISHFIH